MKVFEKYANLALVAALLVATIPAYSMETMENADALEQVEVVKPAQIVWYKRPAAKYALVATALVVIGVKTYFKCLSSIARVEQNKNDMGALMEDMHALINAYSDDVDMCKAYNCYDDSTAAKMLEEFRQAECEILNKAFSPYILFVVK